MVFLITAATSMKWIKAKMEELGLVSHPGFRIAFYLDSLAMITVQAPKYGVIEVPHTGVIMSPLPFRPPVCPSVCPSRYYIIGLLSLHFLFVSLSVKLHCSLNDFRME